MKTELDINRVLNFTGGAFLVFTIIGVISSVNAWQKALYGNPIPGTNYTQDAILVTVFTGALLLVSFICLTIKYTGENPRLD